MRTVIGTTPRALARRGMALDRLAVLTLRRDAYAAPPGETLPLWLGERTHYRAATAIRDTFDRPDGALGLGYTPWIAADAGGLVIQAQQVVPGVLNAEPHLALYATGLPRDQWGEITIRALTGAGAVGLALRVVTQSGYLVGAQPGTTALRRLNAGASTTLLDLVTPWQVGDIVRLTVDWDRLRIFRNGTLIGECVDAAPLLGAGQAALYASQPSASDAAALDDFAAGPLRQEYRGLLADVGDVSASLGFVEPTATPAAWSMSVINLAPVGPPGRFSIAWRHGQNDGPNTYDLHRTPVTLALAVAEGSVSCALAEGRVDHPEALTEGLVRLDCAGRDAFLTPDIQAGVVAYLPGPDPISTPAPIPLDPCGADAVPVIQPGLLPSEPPTAGADEEALVADGPEAAPGPERSSLSIRESGFKLLRLREDVGTNPNESQDLNEIDFITALAAGVTADLPTSLNSAGGNAAHLAAQIGHQHVRELHVTTGVTSTVENRMQALLFRDPAIMPGTRIQVALRTARQRGACTYHGPADIVMWLMAEEWGTTSGIDADDQPLTACAAWAGSTDQAAAQLPEDLYRPYNAVVGYSQAATSCKVVTYRRPPGVSYVHDLTYAGSKAPIITGVLAAISGPSPGPSLNAGSGTPFGCGAAFVPGFPDPADWQLIEFDIGAAELIGVEFDVLAQEDPETHGITYTRVVGTAPPYIPGWGTDNGRANAYWFVPFVITRIWTPEPP
jgi:hypothetical protein